MKFTPVSEAERTKLIESLRRNIEGDAILTSGKDTSFVGSGEVQDEEVITAIKSVPTHY